ncbi:MAG: 2-aminoadipate transaminase [Chloroflexi bacterium]|jgi:2-aminoadipate transaminase|nr:MAG: 2-aminoadipate transaminase [Chloroflexota bacterium]
MPNAHNKLTLEQAAGIWGKTDVRSLLAESAIAIGAGTPTDAGVSWTLDTTVETPITMGGGVPDPGTLPAADLQKALSNAVLDTPEETLRYGGVLGFEGLREELAKRWSAIDGVTLNLDNFITSNGSAGGISNICDAFIEPGDVVIIEAPSFSGSIRTIRGHMAEIVPVSIDEEGVLVDEAAVIIKQLQDAGKRVKLFYTIADFHNPTGVTMSTRRREALIDLCARNQILIMEDAAYADIYFGEAPPPSLYGLANGQGILKVGTFSKPIATGLRIGWIQGREDFIDALGRVKYDMGNSPVLLRALGEYLEKKLLDKHLETMRPLYKDKCEALCESLEKYCSQYVRFVKPDGGFFLWVECIGPKAREVMEQAALLGLIFPVGANFFLEQEKDDTSHIRLAFSTASVDELRRVGPLMREAFVRALGES